MNIEPVYLIPEGPAKPTELGKRWLDNRLGLISHFADVLHDVSKVARIESKEWNPRLDALQDAGIAMAASGIVASYLDKLHEAGACRSQFTSPIDKASGLVIGDIPPGGYKGLWRRRTLPSGASIVLDGMSIRCEGFSP